jgi:ATPase subunit of ABC transporter with duplicated ATPase domains
LHRSPAPPSASRPALLSPDDSEIVDVSDNKNDIE